MTVRILLVDDNAIVRAGYRALLERTPGLIVVGEAIARRRTPKLVVHLLNMIGIVAIVLLMVVVTYHDIARLFVA